MKQRPSRSKSTPAKILALAFGLAVAGISQSTQAVEDTWDGAASGVWDTSALNWSGTVFTTGNDALFTGTPTNNVTSAASLTIGAITLDSSFAGSVTMTGVGATANTVSGAVTVNSGTLTVTNTSETNGAVTAGSIGSASVAIGSGGLFHVNESGNGTSSASRDLTVSNTFTGAGILRVTPSGDHTSGWSTVILSGNLSGFTGTLDILAGASNRGKATISTATQGNVLSSSATVKLASGATLYLNQPLNYGFSTELYGTGNTEGLGAMRIEGGANVTGNVTLFGSSNIGSNSGTGTISGNIGESGGSRSLTKVGSQTISLTGSNSYGGGTTVSAGTVSVGNINALGTGAVTMGGGNLSNTTGVTLANNFTLNNATTFTAGSGTMALNGNITGSPNGSWTLTPTNKITLGGSNSLTLSANFAALLINAGAGGVDITGTTTINGAAGSQASGYMNVAGNVTVAVQSGGSFAVNGTPNAIKPGGIVGQNAAGTSTLWVNGGSLTIGGNTGFALGNNIATATGVLTISSGTATITAGSTTLQDQLNYIAMGRDNATGIINLDGGTLATGRQFVRDSSSGGTVGGGTATFNFNGGVLQAQANQTGGNGWFETATSGNFQVVTTTVKAGGAKIDTNGFDTNINTVLAHDSGLGGTADGGLTKSGSGTLTLGAANTYTGATTVTSGTLAIGASGSINASTTIDVQSGATLDVTLKSGFTVGASQTLKGSGSILGNVTVSGTVAPGSSPGILTVTGSLTLAGVTAMELASNTNVPGTSNDNINVSSTLTYGGALTISSYGGYDLTQPATYNLFTAGTYTGDFASVSVGGNALAFDTGVWSATVGASTYTFTQATGALVVVPEPGTFAMMLGGLGMLTLFRRRRG